MNIEIRHISDVEELLRWRKEVISNVFGIAADIALVEANRLYYDCHITDGSHVAVVASVDGEDAGCGAVCYTDELPSPDNPTGRCAYLMNIYVRDNFRHHGVAHAIVRHLLTDALRRDCGKIYLETTAEGRTVYSSLGFDDMPDMMKFHSASHS